MTPELHEFNPALFEYEPGRRYAWQVFPRVTVATIAFERLELTRRLVASLYRLTHCPFELLVVDNGSTDGTGDWLRGLAEERSNVRVLHNASNVGKPRALLQLRDALDDGLFVYFDNDVELLSNYWLVHLQKAYHACTIARPDVPTSLGLRMVNQEEYGFRWASSREVLPIPADRNDPPRTSYAVNGKDGPAEGLLAEEVVIGWTDFLCGGAWSCCAELLRRVPFEELYPKYIGGDDSFYSDHCRRLGARLGLVENGPIARHNDWPYSEEKIERYRRLATERAVVDRHLVWQRLRRMLPGGRRG